MRSPRYARALFLMALCGAAASVRAQEKPILVRDELQEHLSSELPFGLVAPADAPTLEPPSDQRVRLGRKLFFDPILSGDRTVACASCHQPAHGFATPARVSPGVHGRSTQRNAPSLFNRSLGKSFMWDGRASSLEEQVLLPISNPDEMDLALEDAIARLRADREYETLFEGAYPDGARAANLARSLSAFVSRITLGDSPVDRFQAGAVSALSEAERSGLWIYESKGGCWRCHSGSNFTDESFHDTGVGAKDGEPEPGRFAVTGLSSDKGRFKTPTLRGLAFTAPYMHDGSLATVEEVIAFYRRGNNPNSNLDERLAPLDLTDSDVAHLAAFLRALSRTSTADERGTGGKSGDSARK